MRWFFGFLCQDHDIYYIILYYHIIICQWFMGYLPYCGTDKITVMVWSFYGQKYEHEPLFLVYLLINNFCIFAGVFWCTVWLLVRLELWYEYEYGYGYELHYCSEVYGRLVIWIWWIMLGISMYIMHEYYKALLAFQDCRLYLLNGFHVQTKSGVIKGHYTWVLHYFNDSTAGDIHV